MLNSEHNLLNSEHNLLNSEHNLLKLFKGSLGSNK